MTGVHTLFGDIYDQMGLYEKALAAYQKSDAPGDPWRVVRTNARAGRHDQARRMLEDLSVRKAPRAELAAAAYAALGDKDEAFKLLFAMKSGDWFNYVKVDASLDSLHSDPRWQVLLRRMNLPVDGGAGAVSH